MSYTNLQHDLKESTLNLDRILETKVERSFMYVQHSESKKFYTILTASIDISDAGVTNQTQKRGRNESPISLCH